MKWLILLMNIGVYCTWAEENLTQVISSDGCLLPLRPEGSSYQIFGSETSSWKPGDLVPFDTVIKFTCGNSYIISKNYSRSHCFQLTGTWDPEPPVCLRTCKGLTSNALDLKCYYKSKKVPCNDRAVIGTVVRPTCKGHLQIDDPTSAFRETHCLPDGSWEQPLFNCKVYCGKPKDNEDGEKNPTRQPWMAAIYKYKEKPSSVKNETIKMDCSGTLISFSAILTTSQCLTDKNKNDVDFDSITVILNTVSFYITRNEYEKYKRKVKLVFRHPGYLGTLYNLGIIMLAKSIVGENNLMPICIDWSNKLKPKSGDMGTLTAWNGLSNDYSSFKLTTQNAEFIDYDKCKQQATNLNKFSISATTHCTKYEPGLLQLGGSSNNTVYSPTSFSILKGGHEYLAGIVSSINHQDGLIVFSSINHFQTYIKTRLSFIDDIIKIS